MIIECHKTDLPRYPVRAYTGATKDAAADEAAKKNPGKDVYVAFFGDHWLAWVEVDNAETPAD